MKKITRFLALAFLLALGAAPVIAQSTCPAIINGAVLTAAQWQGCFTAKKDATNQYASPVHVQNAGSSTNEILIQHDGTNGYIRVQNDGGLLLGANATNILNLNRFGFAPIATNSVPLGVPAARWSSVASVKGDFSGQVLFSNLGVQFGGTTAAFPMLINSGAELHVKTADNLSFATSRAQNFVSQAGVFYGGLGSSAREIADGDWKIVKADGSTQGTINGSSLAVPTRQIFTTVGAGTYNRPAGVRQLWVRMCGAGGGGGGWNGGTSGGVGGTTSLGTTTAIGGGGGVTNAGGMTSGANPGAGGTGGADGSGVGVLRIPGMTGASGVLNASSTVTGGGPYSPGGNAPFGFGQGGNMSGTVPSGYCSGAQGATGFGPGTAGGGAGGSGEGVEFLVNSPPASLALSIGAGGVASTAGSVNGGVGRPGVIVIEERY